MVQALFSRGPVFLTGQRKAHGVLGVAGDLGVRGSANRQNPGDLVTDMDPGPLPSPCFQQA